MVSTVAMLTSIPDVRDGDESVLFISAFDGVAFNVSKFVRIRVSTAIATRGSGATHEAVTRLVDSMLLVTPSHTA